jgi:hypothetical protein
LAPFPETVCLVLQGKWKAPLVDNPAFKGVWAPRQIPNPDYFEPVNPFAELAPISALGLLGPGQMMISMAYFYSREYLGFELWTVTGGIHFDNVLVADNEAAAREFADKYWAEKRVCGGVWIFFIFFA